MLSYFEAMDFSENLIKAINSPQESVLNSSKMICILYYYCMSLLNFYDALVIDMGMADYRTYGISRIKFVSSAPSPSDRWKSKKTL